jgi:hypothetical protein
MALAVIDSVLTQQSIFTQSINMIGWGWNSLWVDGKYLDGNWYSMSYGKKPSFAGLDWQPKDRSTMDSMQIATHSTGPSFNQFKVGGARASEKLMFLCELVYDPKAS